jgi:hypothetical protein
MQQFLYQPAADLSVQDLSRRDLSLDCDALTG